MIISFILYFILILLALLIILISTPYSYQISYEYIDSLDYEYNIIISAFYFKFVFRKKRNQKSTYIKILGVKKELKKRTEDKKLEIKEDTKQEFVEKKKDKLKKKSSKSKFPLKIITKNNILHILRFIKKLLKYLIPKKFKINLTIGTDQPDLNGYILAYYYSLIGTYPNIPLTIDINWQESTFKSDGYLKGYIIPIELIFKILLFVFSIPTIKIGWYLYKYKKRKDR